MINLNTKNKQLAILIDPDKTQNLSEILIKSERNKIDFFW